MNEFLQALEEFIDWCHSAGEFKYSDEEITEEKQENNE